MKTSTFALSFVGFCIFYICNADWIDKLYEKLVEDYLGSDYEEVAPFVSSVTAGAEEFDQIVEELTKSKRKWYHSHLVVSFAIIILTFALLLYQVAVLFKGLGIAKVTHEFASYFRKTQNSKSKEEVQNLIVEFLENKLSHIQGKKVGDEVPVKLLWKGGALVESSMHCNVRDESAESKILQMQKQLQSKVLVRCSDVGSGDEKSQLSSTSSDESTALKMAEIRKLLESEPELIKTFIEKESKAEVTANEKKAGEESVVFSKNKTRVESFPLRETCHENDEIVEVDLEKDERKESFKQMPETFSSVESEPNRIRETKPERNQREREKSDFESLPDPKLMNRIRLLESRLRLEELKNKNWIHRMSRAEGILQHLNKQVERIEEARPMETRTETLKITSTVTNWASLAQPGRNVQFSLVNQYRPFSLQMPCMSLSEIIKKEIGFPTFAENNKSFCSIASKPPIPVMSSPKTKPQSLILSKFLSR